MFPHENILVLFVRSRDRGFIQNEKRSTALQTIRTLRKKKKATLSAADNNNVRFGNFYHAVRTRSARAEFVRPRTFLPVFPLKLEGTMLRVIYPALKETRHSGYKRDNKEY